MKSPVFETRNTETIEDYPFYTLLMARGLRPGRDGATRWDSHRDKTTG